MKQFASWLTSAFLMAAFFLAVTTKDAHAYIDAGTGSLLIQFLLGSVFASLFMMKVFWRRLVGQVNRVLSKLKGSKTT